jgi:hypothetical protein
MTHTYTISNTTANTGTITLNSGASYSSPVTITNVGAGGLGGAGQIYTTNGTGTTNWATPNQTQFNGGNGKPVMSLPHGKDEVILEKDATLTVKGNVVINGIDLEERLKTIEKVLMIPERDAIMEAKYPSLKKKFDEYIAALGKYRTFEAIKGNDE